MKKLNIQIICANGMSSTLLSKNIKKEAEKLNLEVEVGSYFISNYKEMPLNEIDVILLAPQVRHQFDEVNSFLKDYNLVVMKIDMYDYGLMNGAAVLEKILKEIKG